MSNTAIKKSQMTLFSKADDIYCYQVRFMLAEKMVTYDLENIQPNSISESLMEINSAGTVPTLVDRNIVLRSSDIILEYLDERFPHPPLMPVFPMERAQKRQLMKDIKDSWYQQIRLAEFGKNETERKKALNFLKEQFLSTSGCLTPYFMSTEFGIIDCYIAPLLWKMQTLGVNFTSAGSKAIKSYMELIFKRESFKHAISNESPTNFMEDK